MSQKYLYVPALVNDTVTGFGGPATGAGSTIRFVPSYVADSCGTATATFSDRLGSLPLNQNGWPAASLTPLSVGPGRISGWAFPELPGRSTS